MARVINPAIRVALILQAVAAGLAGAQAIVWRFDRPTEETASVIPRARGASSAPAFHNVHFAPFTEGRLWNDERKPRSTGGLPNEVPH
jgi:hypothetical protein